MRRGVVAVLVLLGLGQVWGGARRIEPTGFRFTDKHMIVNGGRAVDVSDRRVPVFILLGQSNMVGRGKLEEYPPELAAPDPRILRLEDRGWVVQVPDKKKNGPEISLGHELARIWPQRTIGLIKVALGGVGIRVFAPDWSREAADLVPGNGARGPLYEILRRRIELARRLGDVEFRAVFWEQGGTDMLSKQTATGYLDQLEAIIEAIRRDTGTPDLPLFVSTYFRPNELAQELTRWKTEKAKLLSRFVAAEEVLGAHIEAEERIPHTHTLFHGILPTSDARGHFDTRGQIRLGGIFARGFLDCSASEPR